MLKPLTALTAAAVLGAPAAHSVPEVGMAGMTPAARAVASYIEANYPGVQSIGGIRPCDAIGDHCRGVALDIMIGGNMALGDAIYADLSSHMTKHGIKYLLWRQAAHFDHIHVTVN